MKCNFYTVFIFIVLFMMGDVTARPSRVKRVSDQRLAELETLLALSKMSGKLITVPIGLGKIDPAKIGRRRRSESAGLLERLYIFNNELEDANPYEDLKRILEEE